VTIAATGRGARHLVRASSRRPGLTVLVSALLAVVAVWYTLGTLTFRPDTLDLLPPDAPYVERFREFELVFEEVQDLVVVVEAPAFPVAVAYAERLERALAAGPVAFPRVAYQVDPETFAGRGLLYLPVDEVRRLRDMLLGREDFLRGFAAEPGLTRLVEGVSGELAQAVAAAFLDLGLADDREALDLGVLTVLLDQVAERLDGTVAPYRSPWGALLGLEGDGAGYFVSDDGRLLFVLVQPPRGDVRSFTSDRAAIEAVRGAIAALHPEFPGVEVGVTGAPALAHDEMTTAFGDSATATVLAFGLILATMWVAFRQVGKPVLLLAALAVSLAWSLGAATLAVGHLTIFSVMFIPLVAGIGIDYGIYFLSRYQEELGLGRPLSEALGFTATRSGPGIVLSALTAGGSFYVLGLTDFRGIQELGVIAGSAIVLACIAMLTLLPALLILTDRRRPDRSDGGAPATAHVAWVERLTRYPRTVLVGAGVVTVLAMTAVPSVRLDYNLLNLQAPGVESVVWQRRLQASQWRGGAPALASAESLDELRAKQAAFAQLSTVYEVDSVLRLVPDDQEDKLGILRALVPVLAPVRVAAAPPLDPAGLVRVLERLDRRLALAGSGPAGEPPEVAEVRQRIAGTLERLRASGPARARAALEPLQAAVRADFVQTVGQLRQHLRPEPIRLADVPADLQRRFVGSDGRFLLEIHPRVDIWEREGAEAFVSELRSVDPDVTGAAVTTYEAIRLMERAYQQAAVYAYVLVGVLSLLVIRRLRETGLALLPLVLGLVWTLGLMRLFGLQFNLANVFAVPFLVGACAEFGINVVLGHLEGRERGGPLVTRSSVMGVLVNGVTTLVGFGSLMVAHHQGIFGLGLLLALGAAARLVASLVVLPALLRLLPASPPRAAGPVSGRPGP
jgi:uncharacterized protein